MNAILTDATQTALWHELVREAESRATLTLDDELESYLVFLLMRHLRDAHLAGHVLATDLLEALGHSGHEREQELRATGDRCLLIAGFYPEQAERRLVSLDYFLAMGAHAYTELAVGLHNALADLYQHLARAFTRLVRVLIELRRYSGHWKGPNAFARYSLARHDAKNEQKLFAGALLLDSPEKIQ